MASQVIYRLQRSWDFYAPVMLLGLGVVYASLSMMAEWHYNAGWRLPLNIPAFLFVPKSANIDEALAHLKLAKRLASWEMRYRTSYSIGLTQRALSWVMVPPFVIGHQAHQRRHDAAVAKRQQALPYVVDAVNELQDAVRKDPGDARLQGHLIGLRLELGLPIDGMMDKFISIARAGPSVKVEPAPSP